VQDKLNEYGGVDTFNALATDNAAAYV